jgi:Lon protease-like protein
MSARTLEGFPLFPLGIVALPNESVPLHIFEERYQRLVERCLAAPRGALERQFGIIWLSEEELSPVGCACELEEVLERMDDGRMNILARGNRPFRLLEREDAHSYPAGVVELLDEVEESSDEPSARAARELYRELLLEATDREIAEPELAQMDSYQIAATVEFDLHAKQELLEMRSENARMRLLVRLLGAALQHIELMERAKVRAMSNGKVRFTS